jgi:hypothetical protein
MDAPTASILAAVISAAASVAVAVIGKASSQRAVAPGKVQRQYLPSHTVNKYAWIIVLGVLSVWLALSPILIHGDWGGINFFVLPVVTVFLAATCPLKPSLVASLTLMLYPINFLMGSLVPILQWHRGMDVADIVLLLGVAFGNAVIAWALARWRAPYALETAAENPNSKDNSQLRTRTTLVEQIEALRRLHESGALSDTEYQRAKSKLLES